MYDYPSSVNTSSGFETLLVYVNTVTNGWISNMLLLGIYIIILIGFYKAREDFAGAMAVAGFGVFVVALLFWVANFVNGITLAMSIGLALIGVIVLLTNKREYV